MTMRRGAGWMLFGSVTLSIAGLLRSVDASDPARPRGVGPEFAKFYKSQTEFTCISVPSITIPLARLNDDYCDCPDGSDEPGTSACSYLSPLSPSQPLMSDSEQDTTLALPGFYCKNKNHLPSYIPSQYVNDGKCDYELCCDGSDEWAGVGGVKCEDRCKEIGKEWRMKEDKRLKGKIEAEKNRKGLVRDARTLRDGLEGEINRLVGEVEQLVQREKELNAEFESVQRRERGKVARSPGTGKVGVLVGLAKQRVEELRGGLEGVLSQKKNLETKVAELERILSAFKEEHNPNFNDEGVKRAAKAWEDYAANKADGGALQIDEKDLESMVKPDTDTEGINWAEWENGADEESDVEALYSIEAYLPIPIRSWVHEKISSLRTMLIENGILADTPAGSESKLTATARSNHQEVVNDLASKQQSLDGLRSDFAADYGPEDIFRALKGQCISLASGEYEYELCWMVNTSQKSRKGSGSNTNMGNFARIGREMVDDEVDAGGKGLGSGERMTMVYENGMGCWNGPNRMTTVIMACAEQGEIWRVREMEKCVYRMEVGTPAVCGALDGGKHKKGKGKDEL